jgi:guanosine-3',5'-bis(diphosphate) 3'-pyrophosphohydrolase
MTQADWQRAASFAARAHDGQIRKDGRTPYAAHTFRVAMVIRHVFACDDEVCIAAGLLHDTIEDTDTDYDEILEDFGHEVADCVAAMTKDMRLVEDLREPAYDQQLARADWRARLVKLADVYDNFLDQDAKSRKMVEKMRRALALANADAGRPEIDRAIAAVRALLDGHAGGAA